MPQMLLGDTELTKRLRLGREDWKHLQPFLRRGLDVSYVSRTPWERNVVCDSNVWGRGLFPKCCLYV